MPERRPVTSPEKLTTPLAEEPDVPATALGEPAAAPTRKSAAPPTPQETGKKVEESLAHELPGWTEIHLSHLVPQWGESPQV